MFGCLIWRRAAAGIGDWDCGREPQSPTPAQSSPFRDLAGTARGATAGLRYTVSSKDEPRVSIMIRGSCLCGGVQFAVEEVVGPFELCHCRRCRKTSGSAFMATVGVRRRGFQFL